MPPKSQMHKLNLGQPIEEFPNVDQFSCPTNKCPEFMRVIYAYWTEEQVEGSTFGMHKLVWDLGFLIWVASIILIICYCHHHYSLIKFFCHSGSKQIHLLQIFFSIMEFSIISLHFLQFFSAMIKSFMFKYAKISVYMSIGNLLIDLYVE